MIDNQKKWYMYSCKSCLKQRQSTHYFAFGDFFHSKNRSLTLKISFQRFTMTVGLEKAQLVSVFPGESAGIEEWKCLLVCLMISNFFWLQQYLLSAAMLSNSLLVLSKSGPQWYPPLCRLSVALQGWELWSRAQFHQCGLWSGKVILGSSTGTAMYQLKNWNLTKPSTRARHKRDQTSAASQRERRWLAVAAEIELQSSGLFLGIFVRWLLRLLV